LWQKAQIPGLNASSVCSSHALRLMGRISRHASTPYQAAAYGKLGCQAALRKL